MKAALIDAAARVIFELPYVVMFWVIESVFIVALHHVGVVGWWAIPALFIMNILIVVLCDLLDQLIDRILSGKE